MDEFSFHLVLCVSGETVVKEALKKWDTLALIVPVGQKLQHLRRLGKMRKNVRNGAVNICVSSGAFLVVRGCLSPIQVDTILSGNRVL